jgi:UDP-3-O-[3-hydroxymyristoyl] N-acetylglucosamine deacetylase
MHSGARVTMTLAPSPADTGITFVRVDLGTEIPARSGMVVDTRLSTTLAMAGARVSTVEHVMAALHGSGIDNCRVEVDGPEIPNLDGSAAPFVCLIHEAGVQVQRAGKRYLVIEKAVEIREGDKLARLEPAEAFSVEFTADFNHPLITNQVFRATMSDRVFERELSRARTFCFRKDIDRMQASGLAKGGSLDDVIVIDDFSILNPEGLRFTDEFARHKALDAVGDLALFGMPVIGAYHAVKSGHAMNHALVKKTLADEGSHRIFRIRVETEADGARTRMPVVEAAEGRTA